MPHLVPISPLPNQTFSVSLAGQSCRLNIYARAHCGVVVDVYVLDALVIGGVVAHDRCRIVRNGYLGFAGELAFIDVNGTQDPDWRELGSRYRLLWYPPEEVP